MSVKTLKRLKSRAVAREIAVRFCSQLSSPSTTMHAHLRLAFSLLCSAAPFAAAFSPTSCISSTSTSTSRQSRAALRNAEFSYPAMVMMEEERSYPAMVMMEDERSSLGGTATLTPEKQGGNDEERSPLLERLEQMEGMWYSDDFYGPHGREWVEVRATLIGAGTSSLVAIKVSGDANVPSGKTTWRTRGLPDVGGSSVPAQIQVRADPRDPNGFFWVPGELLLLAEDRIALSVVFSASQRARGTFHKHKVGEGA